MPSGKRLSPGGNAWYATRAAYEGVPAEQGAIAGLVAIPSKELLNRVMYMHYFEQNGVLYKQLFYSTPANWEELKGLLSTLGETSIDIKGHISLQTTETLYRALMDYLVSPTTQGNGSIQIQPIPDQNGDGTTDYQVTYSNGEQQILYLLP